MPRNQPRPSTPYSGEFHLTALRTSGTVRTMSASRRRPTSRFQPGMARCRPARGRRRRPSRSGGFAACEEGRLRGHQGSLLLVAVDRLPLPAAPFEFGRGGLPLLGRFRLARTVEGDRLANERRERGLVNFFSFVDVDRAAYVSVETRVEETGRILQSGPLAE